jgi:DNA primase
MSEPRLKLGELKKLVKLEEIAGNYIFDLVKKGNEYKSCCPFHDDKTPSFSINTSKQRWFCHVCDKDGDVFDFLIGIGKTLPEAILIVTGDAEAGTLGDITLNKGKAQKARPVE